MRQTTEQYSTILSTWQIQCPTFGICTYPFLSVVAFSANVSKQFLGQLIYLSNQQRVRAHRRSRTLHCVQVLLYAIHQPSQPQTLQYRVRLPVLHIAEAIASRKTFSKSGNKLFKSCFTGYTPHLAMGTYTSLLTQYVACVKKYFRYLIMHQLFSYRVPF